MEAALELGDCLLSVTATAWVCNAEFPYIHFCVHIQTDSGGHDTSAPKKGHSVVGHLL